MADDTRAILMRVLLGKGTDLDKLDMISNLVAEKMARMHPRPCRHGCSTETLEFDARKLHEASCVLRPYTCPARGCNCLLSQSSVEDHFKSAHGRERDFRTRSYLGPGVEGYPDKFPIFVRRRLGPLGPGPVGPKMESNGV